MNTTGMGRITFCSPAFNISISTAQVSLYLIVVEINPSQCAAIAKFFGSPYAKRNNDYCNFLQNCIMN